MRKLIAVIYTLTLGATLSGCGYNYEEPATGGFYMQSPDGKSVPCVMSNGSISCDWSNAH